MKNIIFALLFLSAANAWSATIQLPGVESAVITDFDLNMMLKNNMKAKASPARMPVLPRVSPTQIMDLASYENRIEGVSSEVPGQLIVSSKAIYNFQGRNLVLLRCEFALAGDDNGWYVNEVLNCQNYGQTR